MSQNKTIGYMFLIVGSLLIFLSYIFLVGFNVTSFDIIIIRDLHNMFNDILRLINNVQFIGRLIFLIGLFFLTNNIFKRNINRILYALIILVIIIFVLARLFSLAKLNDTTMALLSFYNLLYFIFCITFIIFLIMYESKLNFGILLITAFFLQVFVLEISGFNIWYTNHLFKVFGLTLKTVFQGLSYLLFAIYGLKRIKS